MTLLDEIVNLLSDNNSSLEAALLKTKVLLHQIGHKDLVPWVSNELTGYTNDAELPEYRTVQSQPHAHVQFGFQQHLDFPLPLYQLSAKQKANILTTHIRSSIGTIEQQVKNYRENHTGLILNLPPEYASAFQKELTPGSHIISLWCTINMADIESIAISVRSRLLDFALELQGVVGVDAAPQQLLEIAATVDAGQMFRTAVFNISGGTAIFGSTNVQVNNQQGDIEGLISEVAKLGYDKAELDELRVAVLEDKSKNEKPNITEGETSKWYVKALKKVGKGTVDAGIDIISKVISDSLRNYGG